MVAIINNYDNPKPKNKKVDIVNESLPENPKTRFDDILFFMECSSIVFTIIPFFILFIIFMLLFAFILMIFYPLAFFLR